MQKSILVAVIAFVVAGTISFFAAFSGVDVEFYQPAIIGAAFAVLVVFLFYALRGNKSVQRGSAADTNAARAAAPPPGQATVFVYRDQFVGRAVGSDLVVDGKAVGQLRGKTFYRLDLAPGEHRLVSSMANNKDATATVTISPGETTYLRVALKMGLLVATQTLETVPAPAAAAALAGCRLLLRSAPK